MNNSVELPNIERQPRVRRSTYIANHLRDMISMGTLKPGDRLPTEEQLCKHFGVSRTTLRESVQMLRVSGLLDVTPGKGSFICLPNPSILMKDLALLGQYEAVDRNEIASLRSMIELDMIGHICCASQNVKKGLHAFVVNRQDSAEAIEQSERNWHKEIAKSTGNSLSALILDSLMNMQLGERLKRFADAEEVMLVMGSQIRINSAIMENDKALATRLMVGYLSDTSKLNASAVDSTKKASSRAEATMSTTMMT